LAEYPYITVPGALKKFLESVKTMGVPPKITIETLAALGYKSNNHRPIPRILKFIGFLDDNNAPTTEYTDFRLTNKSKAVMAQALRRGYPELFQLYPDAYRRDDEALRNFFAQHTTSGEQVVTKTIDTFKTLCELADFEAQIPPTGEGEGEEIEQGRGKKELPNVPSPPALVINLNIQLGLPATEDATIYDRIFESLKKHILTR
jgi:hypothetical protein